MKKNKHFIHKSPKPPMKKNAEGVLVCLYCEDGLSQQPGPRKKTRDHIVPKHLFGSNHPLNKCRACQECNKMKNNFMPSQFAHNILKIFLPNAETMEQKLRLQKIMQNCMNLGSYIHRHKHLLFTVKTNF